MKKLMITAAAALCAAVGLADGISSQNVVGYQNVNGAANQKAFIGSTFERADGMPVTLGDIGINDSFAPLSDTVTILNEYGGEEMVFVYMDSDTANGLKEDLGLDFVAGWYDYYELDSWDEESLLPNYNSKTLEYGQSLMLQVADSNAAFVFSGAVSALDPELSCKAQAKAFRANCTPLQLTMGDVLVNEFFAPLSDTVTFLNEYGGEKKVYVYMDADTATGLKDDLGLDFVAGWYDYYELEAWDEESLLPNYNSEILAPGAGFMVQASSDDAALILPSPL